MKRKCKTALKRNISEWITLQDNHRGYTTSVSIYTTIRVFQTPR